VTCAMANLVEDIRSRGYWEVIIRPTKLVPQRVPDISALYPIVAHSSVQFRGWDFPHIDEREKIIAIDWVGQETRWEHMREAWRLYRSGQFYHLGGIWDDWRDESKFWPSTTGWQRGSRLGIGDVLFRFAEIFEFAARLATSRAGDDSMHVEVRLSGLADRVLSVDSPNRLPSPVQHRITINEFPFERDVARTELVADPRALALEGAVELFLRFDWHPPVQNLKIWQSELGRL
jgi:hypothetical protein